MALMRPKQRLIMYPANEDLFNHNLTNFILRISTVGFFNKNQNKIAQMNPKFRIFSIHYLYFLYTPPCSLKPITLCKLLSMYKIIVKLHV